MSAQPPKIVYWPRLRLARPQIEAQVGAIAGVQLKVVESLEALVAEIPGALGVIMPDAPPDQARQVTRLLGAPDATVRWLHVVTAGRNGLDAAGLPPGLAVSTSRGATAPGVAEHGMALLLALARRIPDMVRDGGEHRWEANKHMTLSDTLEDKRMLVVGLGPIGHEVMKRARAFGMRVEAVARSAREEPGFDAVRAMPALDERLPEADVLVLCAPLTPETRHMIDARRLALMRPHALLINIARGALVEQDALVAALRAGRLGGAGLDVTDPEPLPADSPLWDCPGVIVSPHVAGGIGLPSMNRVGALAAENCRRLLAGQPLLNQG